MNSVAASPSVENPCLRGLRPRRQGFSVPGNKVLGSKITVRILLAGFSLGSITTMPVFAEEKPAAPTKQAEQQTKDRQGGAQKNDKAGGSASGQSGQDAGDSQEDLINPDRPGIANGSQVIGPRRFQIEAGVQTYFLGGGSSTARFLSVPTLLRFGLDKRYEIRVETLGYSALSTSDPVAGLQHAEGFGQTSIGFKRTFQASSGAKHPGVGTIVRFFPASGGGGFETNHATYDALLCADWDFAPHLSLNPNIGFGVNEDSNGILYGNFQLASTLTYAPTTHLGFFVDFGYQAPEEAGGSESLIYDAGATYIVGRNVQLDVSVGTGARGRTSPHPFWSAGVSVRF